MREQMTKTLDWLGKCVAHALIKRGSNFDNVFSFSFFSSWGMGGSKYHYKWAIIGPPAKSHLNGVSLAYWWWLNIECWLGSFVIFQEIWTRIARKPYILVCAFFFFFFFLGGGGGWGRESGLPVPSGSAHGADNIFRMKQYR